jgi:hypothetical protein
MEHRLAGMNEIRAQLSDQARAFLPRAEYQAHHGQLEDLIHDLGSRLDRMQGMTSGQSDTVARIIAVVAVLASVASAVAVLIVGIH